MAADAEFSDNRSLGDFRSRYPATAWVQISIETAYLLILLLLTATGALLSALNPSLPFAALFHGDPTRAHALQRQFQIWCMVFFSGMAGATAFSTKWLYHSVARNKWNRDRLIWRLSVPFQGGILAVFTGAMILSGLIPLLNKALFLRLVSCAGYGFLVGLFADNFLAALEKFAGRVLGTLGKSE